MTVRFLIFFLFLLLGSTIGRAQNEEHIFHEVGAGETKYGISRQYGITIEELEKFNPEIKSGLREGLVLLIPKKKGDIKPALPADSGFVYHNVKPEETLYSLSRRYGVSILEIEQHNPGLKDGLKAGQRLKIPVGRKTSHDPQGPSDQYVYHKVEAGETAYSLSKRYNVSLDSLYLLNPAARDGLQIGKALKFPQQNPVKAPVETAVQATGKPVEERGTDEPAASKIASRDTGAYFLYQVKTGDSFFSLKQNFKVTREELIALNPELQKGLELDKYIIIPRKSSQPQDVGWLDKLFKEVEPEKTTAPEEVPEEKLARKDALNMPEPREKPLIEVEDTAVIDIHQNYLVALMLPFYANQDTSVDKELSDSKIQAMALEFYSGFLMAADTLSKRGMNLTLNVIDTRNSLFRVKEKIEDIKQARFDMVVGPLYKDNVEYVADQLKKDNIPVISPLSKAVDVKGRANLIQCIPGPTENSARIATMINTDFQNANITFVHTGSSEEREDVKQIKARLAARFGHSFVREIVAQKILRYNEVRDAVVSGRRNIFITTSEEQVLLNDLVNKLRQMHDTSIYLVGPSKLTRIRTLESNYLNNLKLTMPDITFIDYSDPETNNFIRKYRERYEGEPSRFAFQGYDIGIYFLNKLWKNGKYLLYSLDDAEQMLNMGFAIQKTKDGGYQNEYLYITGIRNFTLVKL